MFVGDKVLVLVIDWMDWCGMVEDVLDCRFEIVELLIVNVEYLFVLFVFDWLKLEFIVLSCFFVEVEFIGIFFILIFNKVDLVL